MSKTIFILNGPNLNLLGTREPHLYGTTTLAEIEACCRERANALGLGIEFRQTNHEGVLVEWIHEAISGADGIVINPAGYTFRSIAILDALKMFNGPSIELHITNIHKRDPIYHHSVISQGVTAVMAGLGAGGYVTALESVARLADEWARP
ncbi:MAG: 3-dehydroquinate dehydratase [Burkholderiaceae bacterium]|nr:3-dehydroquinate dehydratase [Burkholderiaceae bacterium]